MKSLKLFLVLSLLFVSSLGMTQSLPLDPETNKVVFQDIIAVDSVNKDELYERAKDWLIRNFKESKLKLDDKANGQLIKQGEMEILLTYDFKYKNTYVIPFNATIDVKEGRIRYTFDNLTIYDLKNGAKTAQPIEVFYSKLRHQSKGEFVSQLNSVSAALIENLKAGVTSPKKTSGDDW